MTEAGTDAMARLLKAAIKNGCVKDWDAVVGELLERRRRAGCGAHIASLPGACGTQNTLCQGCYERAYPDRGGWPECVRCRSNKWVQYGIGLPWGCKMCGSRSCDGKTWMLQNV